MTISDVVGSLGQGIKGCPSERQIRRAYLYLTLLIVWIALISMLGSEAVSAAQTTESSGPDGYGWQQTYEVFDAASGSATRVTGTVDRQYYDYGYKQVQISGRKENYWSRDCGWWYVSGESNLNVTVKDAAGDSVFSGSSLSTTKGRYTVTVPWGVDDDPGEWTATVDDGTTQAVFKFYVRGVLEVYSIGTSPANPTTGTAVTVNATIKDNAGNLVANNAQDNNGTTVKPAVTAFVTGSGESFKVTLVDDGTGADSTANDGVWTGQFTPSAIGDHKIKVKASDDHTYWVDGSGSTYVSVGGTFPYASPLLSFLKGTSHPFLARQALSSLAVLFGVWGFAAARRRGNRE